MSDGAWLAIRIAALGAPAGQAVAGQRVAGWALLTNAERAEAAALRDPVRAHAFLAGRAVLRQLLCDLCGPALAGSPFGRSVTGKPFLPSGGPEFNLSRAGGLAAVAVASQPVGIDLEVCRALDPALLARLPAEAGATWLMPEGALPRPDVADPLRRWTLAEARVKRSGGRLAEWLAAWQRRTDAPVCVIAVPAPRGHVCTCCIAGDPGRVAFLADGAP